MAGRPAGGGIGEELEALGAAGRLGDLPDGPLLARARLGGEVAARAAFAALVERHGPMVLRACRAELRDAHAAEDAFQATFLVLARRAGAIRQPDSVAGWLHGVARKVAARARADAARRRGHERRAGESRPARTGSAADPAEPFAELHAALARLPARYRDPLILCYFEGLTADEAAGRLGCPRGTVLSRLARGRDRLRARLSRGLPAPVAGPALAARLAAEVPACIPPTLAGATARSASRILAGASPAGLVAPAVAELAERTLRMMAWTKLQTIGLAGLALATLALGARAGLAPLGPEPAAPPRQAPPAPAPPPRLARAAILAPLPPRAELHRLLRRAATEAIEAMRAEPRARMWPLMALAAAQARAGDRAGARDTLEAAVRKAAVFYDGEPDNRALARLARAQADAGLREEARRTLWRALAALPATGADEPERGGRAAGELAEIARAQARIGQPAEARATADRLLRFVAEFLASGREASGPPAPPAVPGAPLPPSSPSTRDVLAATLVPTLAAVGDFDGAFRWADEVALPGAVLGEVALAAAQCLDRAAARPFVAEAATRLTRLRAGGEADTGLSMLAEAQARVGDIEAARRSALAIGGGANRGDEDRTDGPPTALLLVAKIQDEAGDPAGAAATLRVARRSVRDRPRMRSADDLLGAVAAGLARLGDLDEALRAVELMRAGRAEPLARVARQQAAAGREADARATLDRAVAAATEAAARPARPGVSFPALDRAQLAQVRAMAGDVPGAVAEARRIADGHSVGVLVWSQVAQARAAAGDVAGALELALAEAPGPADRLDALSGLAAGVVERLDSPSLDPESASRPR